MFRQGLNTLVTCERRIKSPLVGFVVAGVLRNAFIFGVRGVR